MANKKLIGPLIIGLLVIICILTSFSYYKEQKIKEHISKGWSYYKQQKLDKARDEFKMVIDLAPNAEAFYGTGVTFAETDPDKARQNLLTAEKLDPNHPYVDVYLGSLAFMEKNYQEAIRYYEKAIALSPDNPDFYGSLMEVYFFSGNKEKLKEVIKEYRKRFPDKPDIIPPQPGHEPDPPEYGCINKGIEYINQQNYKEAQKCFKEALRINPCSYVAEYGLGLCYMTSDKEKAKEHFTKAIQFKPDYVEPNISLAEISFTDNDNTQTIEYCTKGLTLAPNTAKLNLLLGLAYYRSGNKSKALEPLKKYLELDPNGTNANTVKQIIEQIK